MWQLELAQWQVQEEDASQAGSFGKDLHRGWGGWAVLAAEGLGWGARVGAPCHAADGTTVPALPAEFLFRLIYPT